VKHGLLTGIRVSAALAGLLLWSTHLLAENTPDPLQLFNINLYHAGVVATPYSPPSGPELQLRPGPDASESSAFQRTLNHQWLSTQTGSSSMVEGDYAVARLIERQLKSYLDNLDTSRWFRNLLMPDGDGFIKSVDYGVEVHSNRLVIGIVYEF